jgi:hypothetical protein
MSRKYAFHLSLVLLFASIICAGCGLNRSSAASIISKHERFVTTKSRSYYDWLISQKNADSEDGELARALISLGYMDATGKLTKKGDEAKNTWKAKDTPVFMAPDYRTYEIPLGKREIILVTGLSDVQNPLGSFVQATFTWHWSPVSDVGTEMKIDKNTYTGAALLQKYDDGWRIPNIQFEGQF